MEVIEPEENNGNSTLELYCQENNDNNEDELIYENYQAKILTKL
jgi:hypothetical protein